MTIDKNRYYDKKWYVKDISESQNTFGFLTLNTYSREMEEDVEIASVIANDIDCEMVVETFNVISKANEMHKLLEKCYEKLDDTRLKNQIKKLLERDLEIKEYE